VGASAFIIEIIHPLDQDVNQGKTEIPRASFEVAKTPQNKTF
jgi:hypothetical protein